MSANHKPKNMAERKYQRVYTSDPLAEVDQDTRDKIAPLENYIMKNCLWQFNSRGWDRRKQNANILAKTAQLLCDEPVENPTGLEKCYWVDAVLLDRAYRERFPWIKEMAKDDIKALMRTLNARLDWLTIDGSLNLELTVVNY
ncbi:Fe-only nitrogenase subunit delta [Geobacter sp. SVR]|uniref:Fe-only nitrogenase subunit delta n=1 Tax=Geobacter sp. SVR TaxID=2495594 RepID=UPI00143F0252|nr:Fe-only nitrogenase subunit delta [Geobacter sp. SVR]BCS55074.1 nitrogenase iron-iron protein delta chain [Geobacter sp. SVR]GCF85256.1 nitrogenase iron-iron protein delta chain [Geobacter sp. SVR]